MSVAGSSLPTGFMEGPLPDFIKRDEKYLCLICKQMLQVPHQTRCGHRMCKECLDKKLEEVHQFKCPGNEDYCEEITAEVIIPDFSALREIRMLSVYCTFKNYGCKEELPWGKLASHVEKCDYAVVDCPNQSLGCCEKVKKDKVELHALKLCKYRLQLCSYCQQQVAFCQMENHHQAADGCPEFQIPCPYKCGEQAILRKELRQHQQTCPARPKECPYKDFGCKELGTEPMIKSHITNSAAHHVDLVFKVVSQNNRDINSLKRTIEQVGEENGGLRQELVRLSTSAQDLMKKSGEMKKKMGDQEKQTRTVQKSFASQGEKVLLLERSMKNCASKEELDKAAQDIRGMQSTIKEQDTKLQRLETKQASQSLPEDLRQKLIDHDKQHGITNLRLAELDLRLECLERTSYDGCLLWIINNYKRRRDEAKTGKVLSVYSQPFYTSKYGYKLCARAYLNGDGVGKGTHISLFFLVMKGDYDALLPWPFRQRVVISLVDQEGTNKPISDTFMPDPGSSSFARPRQEMNVASGYPLFATHSTAEKLPYLKNDFMYLKIKVELDGLKDPSMFDDDK